MLRIGRYRKYSISLSTMDISNALKGIITSLPDCLKTGGVLDIKSTLSRFLSVNPTGRQIPLLNVKKYNPGFLTDDELAASFCVRLDEFESVVETLLDSGASSSTHTIVVGPRGSGKTHLLLRIAAETRRREDLSNHFPIIFMEESYEVSTIGEFWLECLGHLAEQAPPQDRPGLSSHYSTFRSMPFEDDRVLAESCLGVLLEFANRHEKRLLLVVENLNALFGEMLAPDAGWRLRKTLQVEKRFTLLGSAANRFAEIDNPEHALYDLFRIVHLPPLTTDECVRFWSTLTRKTIRRQQIRPVEILTGGNPRLITVIAGFQAGHSFRELMENLLDLVDEHTAYFKSHLDALPHQERRVYATLARLWRPATVDEVAELARLDVDKCGALLLRLEGRGAVEIERGNARPSRYYLSERMFNIYYLLRRPGGEQKLVETLIKFMAIFYSPRELLNIGIQMARDWDVLDLRTRGLQRVAFKILIDMPEVVDAKIAEPIAEALLAEANVLAKNRNYGDAIKRFDRVIESFEDREAREGTATVAAAKLRKGMALCRLGRIDEGWASYVEGVSSVDGNDLNRVDGLAALLADRDSDSGVWCRAILEIIGLLHLGRSLEVMSEINDLLGLDLPADDEFAQYFQTLAIGIKGFILANEGRALDESEVITLLSNPQFFAGHPTDAWCLQMVLVFSASVDPSEALELIEESPSAERMMPLVVALRNDVGKESIVAHEVRQVARDVNDALATFRKMMDSGQGIHLMGIEESNMRTTST